MMKVAFTHRTCLFVARSCNARLLTSFVATSRPECSRCTSRSSFFSSEAVAISSSTDKNDSSTVERVFRPPSALERPELRIQGVTKADLESNEELAAFYQLNFPEEKDVSYSFYRPNDASIERQQTPSENNIRDILCYRRNVDGSRICRRLRYHKLIPGVLYGGDPTKNIHSKSRLLVLTPHNEIHRERDRWHHSFTSRVYNLTVYPSKEEKEAGVEGEVVRVIPRDVQLHPVKNNVYCVNYLRYYPGRPVDIPIIYVNEEESPILKRGGFIVPINRRLKCVIEDGVPIPEYLELDCTGAKTKEKLGLSRIAMPEGVKLVKSINTTTWFHGSVFGKGL